MNASQAGPWVSGFRDSSRSNGAIGLSFVAFLVLIVALAIGDDSTKAISSAVAAILAATIMVLIADSTAAREGGERSLWLGFGGAMILRGISASIVAVDMGDAAIATGISELTLGLNAAAAALIVATLLFLNLKAGASWTLTLLDVVLVASVATTAFCLILTELDRAPDSTMGQVSLALGLVTGDSAVLAMLVVLGLGSSARNVVTRWLVAGWALTLVADFESGLSLLTNDIDASAIHVMTALAGFTLGIAGTFHLTGVSPSLDPPHHHDWPKKRSLGIVAILIGCLACLAALVAEASWGRVHDERRIVLSLAAIGVVAGLARLTLAANRQGDAAEALRERQAELEQQAMTDSITELPNHRALLSRLTEEVERAKRFKQPLSVCFVDVDAFKQINDTLGHQTGDEVLREIGSMLRANARQIDIVARYGGEEFVILLPGTWTDDALLFAERLREAIAITVIRPQDNVEIRLSVSIGVAGLPEHATDRDSLLKRADDAVYVAKRSGRNQVHLYDPNLPLGSGAAFTADDALRLVQVVELRQTMSTGHSEEVARLSAMMAARHGLDASEVDRIRQAALLHDVGKISVPDSILAKKGSLSPREAEIVRGHPLIGARLLESNAQLVVLSSAVRHHHERWDGTGYPYRLAGENIPLGARIIAVADAYSAMTSDSPWSSAKTDREAIAELTAMSGKQFDPKLVELFVRMVEASRVIEVR